MSSPGLGIQRVGVSPRIPTPVRRGPRARVSVSRSHVRDLQSLQQAKEQRQQLALLIAVEGPQRLAPPQDQPPGRRLVKPPTPRRQPHHDSPAVTRCPAPAHQTSAHEPIDQHRPRRGIEPPGLDEFAHPGLAPSRCQLNQDHILGNRERGGFQVLRQLMPDLPIGRQSDRQERLRASSRQARRRFPFLWCHE
jgi:hypothetical protein